MKRRKRNLWAYLDGKKLVDVLQAALDNHISLEEMKARLIKANPGHEITFKTK